MLLKIQEVFIVKKLLNRKKNRESSRSFVILQSRSVLMHFDFFITASGCIIDVKRPYLDRITKGLGSIQYREIRSVTG